MAGDVPQSVANEDRQNSDLSGGSGRNAPYDDRRLDAGERHALELMRQYCSYRREHEHAIRFYYHRDLVQQTFVTDRTPGSDD